MRNDGEVVVITGAGQDIGRAMALRLGPTTGPDAIFDRAGD